MVKLKIRYEIIKNIRLVGGLFFILLTVIGARAYTLQIIQSEWLTQKLMDQVTKKELLSSRRGAIYDRNRVELAVSLDVDSLYARTRLIQNKKDAAQKLSSILGIPRDKILNIIQSKQSFVWVRRKINPEQAEKIKDLKISGLGFIKEAQRFYPHKELAGQLLGFVGVDSQGLEGIEREFDKQIKGASGYLLVNRDALGRDLFPEGIKKVDSLRGYNLVLTIDKNVQYIVEKELQAAVTAARARNGLAVVMDPRTGEILASAVAPAFNPNQGSITGSIWKNRAITDVFEPGSTFKPFVVGSALEEGVVKPADIYDCENGSYYIGGKIIHDVHPHGLLSVTEVIKFSSNIGASKIAQHLGRERFYNYIRKFGFSQETGIELPGEVTGFIPHASQWREINLGTISFGQGVSVTALQMAAAYSAIANGGLLMRPYLVQKIQEDSGAVIQTAGPTIIRRVISDQSARMLREMLKTVTEEGGTGQKARVEGFDVAGKTGTAQKIAANGKGYSDKCVSSFVGFIPAQDPKLTIVIVIDEPQGVTYGGVVAAPAFSKMAQQILCYHRIYPESSFQRINPDPGWRETKGVSPGKGPQG
jgi:cell division protein FtsI (penicillin-binding protein 3)